MINNVAVLEFSTSVKDKNHVVKIADVKSELTQAEMVDLMDFILTNNVFQSPQYGELVGKVSCELQKVETESMTW